MQLIINCSSIRHWLHFFDDEKVNEEVNLEVNEEIFEERQVEFAQQEQNDPNISPLPNDTTIYNQLQRQTFL